MNEVINNYEKDAQKLPEDQKHIFETEAKYNGEVQNLGDPNMKVCTPPEQNGKITSVYSALQTVVKYGNRTSEYGSTTGHCYKPPRSGNNEVSNEKEVEIKAEYVNEAKVTYRYGKQDKAMEPETLGTLSYMVKGFRDIEGPNMNYPIFGYNESGRAGYDLYERDAPTVKKTAAGYSSINQI